MPMYTFACADCGGEVEVITPFADRDRSRLHSEEVEGSGCGGALIRGGVEKITIVSSGFEPGAVMSDGSIRRGHFGKEARKKSSGSYRP